MSCFFGGHRFLKGHATIVMFLLTSDGSGLSSDPLKFTPALNITHRWWMGFIGTPIRICKVCAIKTRSTAQPTPTRSPDRKIGLETVILYNTCKGPLVFPVNLTEKLFWNIPCNVDVSAQGKSCEYACFDGDTDILP
ncbi:uncharacterized protein ARMOST_02220 [Armillaria ostoyae]|uniref:Uncharacterized protein n=1 Tax=Armillaria ostoyae TaxID=47428 RepID=A0A284QR43_ARMOS|nr:uncharacterized protein ARMOST_02220 [Armillaria ostoyae]